MIDTFFYEPQRHKEHKETFLTWIIHEFCSEPTPNPSQKGNLSLREVLIPLLGGAILLT